MNISDSVDKLLDSIVIYDDIWGKEEDGSRFLEHSQDLDDVVQPGTERSSKKKCCYLVLFEKR